LLSKKIVKSDTVRRRRVLACAAQQIDEGERGICDDARRCGVARDIRRTAGLASREAMLEAGTGHLCARIGSLHDSPIRQRLRQAFVAKRSVARYSFWVLIRYTD
jgi:hypothetical protein